MTFVIGDIHGELTKLKALIAHIDELDKGSSLVFIGDYIDKGEDPKKTIDYLYALNTTRRCYFIMGNHEYCWLHLLAPEKDYRSYLLRYGGLNTMKSFGTDDILIARHLMLNEYASFFGALIPYHYTGKFVITHSGVDPNDFEMQIENIPAERLLFNRYAFIQHEGYYLGDYKIIFGHTGFYEPYVDAYKIGIDTAACFLQSQPLTAYCIDENMFINSIGVIKQCKTLRDSCPNIVRVKPWRSLED